MYQIFCMLCSIIYDIEILFEKNSKKFLIVTCFCYTMTLGKV